MVDLNPPGQEDEQKMFSETGAVVRLVYMERSMMCYVVQENELKQLSNLNTQALILFSIGSALLSIALTIWLDASFEQTLTPIAQLLVSYAAPFLTFLSIVVYGFGIWVLCARKSFLKTIRKESNRKADI